MRFFRTKKRTLFISLACATSLAVTGVIASASAGSKSERAATMVVALIGDNPYGATQEAGLPKLIGAINADANVARVFHVGDTKAGGLCDDAYFTRIRDTYFDQFNDPVFLNLADNDWTDCHRADNGSLDPVQRLDAARRIFFPRPGYTLGKNPLQVDTQSTKEPDHAPFVENVRTRFNNVLVATVHVVGSGNGCDPWSVGESGRQAEFESRMKANQSWIDSTFLRANNENAPGVMLVLHAEPTSTPECFEPIQRQIRDHAKAFGKPVLVVHGDEHVYRWTPENYLGVPNLKRIEVYGNQVQNWVRLTIDTGDPQVFSQTSQNVG